MKKCFYKYRPLKNENLGDIHEYTKQLLQEGKLYFSSPLKFNDPFDGLVDYDETVTPEDIKPLGRRLGIGEKQLQELVDIYNRDPSKFDNVTRQQYVKFQQDSKLKILCLTSTELSPLLWAHYAANHTGVCIGFKAYQLNKNSYGIKLRNGCIDPELLCPGFPNMMIPFPVEYTNEVPPKYHFGLGNAEALKKSFTSKSKEWAYEQEFRVVATEQTLLRNPVEIDVNEIEEIIFGLNAASELIEKVKDIVSKRPYKSPFPKLYQCRRIPGTYRLEKRPLNL